MFEGRLDAVINNSLIVTFAHQIDEESDVHPDIICEFKTGSHNLIPQAVYGSICYLSRDEIIQQNPRDIFAMWVSYEGVEVLKVSVKDFKLTVTRVLRSSNLHQIICVVMKAVFAKQ